MIAAQKNISIKLYEFNRYNNTQNMILQELVDNKTLLLFVAVTVVVIIVFFFILFHRENLAKSRINFHPFICT